MKQQLYLVHACQVERKDCVDDAFHLKKKNGSVGRSVHSPRSTTSKRLVLLYNNFRIGRTTCYMSYSPLDRRSYYKSFTAAFAAIIIVYNKLYGITAIERLAWLCYYNSGIFFDTFISQN